jgi:hypothetical protein
MESGSPQILSPLRNESSIASVEQVLERFRQVRAALAELLHAVGTDASQTRETARILGLNRGLAWRLTRVVRQPESPDVIADVPGRQSVAQFLDACRTRGAAEHTVLAAQRAFEAFESAVDSCSGDRKTLGMLLSNHRDAGPSGEQERARRKLFDGACSVWGVQAQLRFVTVFLFPSPDDPNMLDAGHVTGFVGFRRLSERAWPLTYEAVHDKSGSARQYHKEPLDPHGSSEGQLQLLKAFCSPPNPEITVSQVGSFKRFELAPGPVGNEGLTTCVFGIRMRKLYPRYSATPDTAGFMVLQQTPVERVLFDFFVHRDLKNKTPPHTQLLDRLTFPHGSGEAEFRHQELAFSEQAVSLSRGAAGGLHPLLPWYSRLLTYVCERIGQPLDDFEGSRFEMAYPPIATILSRRVELGPPPAA